MHIADEERLALPAPGRPRLRQVPDPPGQAGADDPGGSVTAIADLLSDRDRAKLLARIRHLEQLAELVREVPEQRPPDPPPTLSALSTADLGESAVS